MSDSDSYRHPVEEIAEEFSARRRRGESPTIEEYARRFPELAEDIRDLLPTFLVMERIGDESFDDDEDSQSRTELQLERLGDFLVVREVGRGGMGVVYEAEQESLDRRVALKVMLPRVVVDDRQTTRFRREARAAARLHHTNIVPVYGVGQHDGMDYFVMQFIEGQGLDQVLNELRRQRSGVLRQNEIPSEFEAAASEQHVGAESDSISARSDAEPTRAPAGRDADSSSASELYDSGSSINGVSSSFFRAVARLFIQAAEALDYAHSQNILHRDIKPSNLMLDINGMLWVTDFGLAKDTGSDDLTLSGDLVGTLRYMAPERFRSECTAQSDIYGLGLTLFEMLTLEPAYRDTERAALMARIMNEDPPRPRSIEPLIPRDLETIALKALAREPRHRYEAAEEMAEDLRRFLDHRPLKARRVGPVERLWRWCRRNPTVAGLTAIVAVLVVAVGVTGIVGYQNTLDALVVAQTARTAESRATAEATRKALEAEAARTDAEHAFQEAAGAVDKYFTEVGESTLLDIPGLQPLRRELLKSALTWYERLIELQAGRQELRGELARSHLRAGRINGLLGSREEAARGFETGIRLFQQLRSEPEFQDRFDAELAECHQELARVLHISGRSTDALKQLDLAVRIQRESAAVASGDAAAIVDLALTFCRRSSVWIARFEQQPAIADCEQAIFLLKKLDADVPRLDEALAEAFERLGDAHADPDHGNFHASLEPYSESVRYRQRVLERKPEDLHQQYQLAGELKNLGRAKFGDRRITESIADFERALEIIRNLHDGNPAVADYHRELVATHDRLGMVYGRIRRPVEAIDHFNQAVSLQVEFVRRHGGHRTELARLGQLQLAVALHHVQAGNADQAQESFSNAIATTKRILPFDENTKTDARFEVQTYAELGAMHRLKQDMDSARVWFEKAIARAAELQTVDSDTLEHRVLSGQLHNDLGSAKGSSKRYAEAADAFAAAIDGFLTVLHRSPGHPQGRHGLYIARWGRGMSSYYLKDFATAAREWNKANRLAPPEYRSFTSRWLGFARLRADDHIGAAEAAEDLATAESARFYYEQPYIAEKCRYQAAQILALAAQAAAADTRLNETDRLKHADRHAQRSIELLTTAAADGLFSDPAHQRSLAECEHLNPVRERSEFRALLSDYPPSDKTIALPATIPGHYWPPSHFGQAPR